MSENSKIGKPISADQVRDAAVIFLNSIVLEMSEVMSEILSEADADQILVKLDEVKYVLEDKRRICSQIIRAYL